MQWNIYKYFRILDSKIWYNHRTEKIIRKNKKNNRPDIMVKNYNRKICFLINNTAVQEYNKISKYKHMGIEIEKVWHHKTTTMSLIVKVLGMI